MWKVVQRKNTGTVSLVGNQNIDLEIEKTSCEEGLQQNIAPKFS